MIELLMRIRGKIALMEYNLTYNETLFKNVDKAQLASDIEALKNVLTTQAS